MESERSTPIEHKVAYIHESFDHDDVDGVPVFFKDMKTFTDERTNLALYKEKQTDHLKECAYCAGAYVFHRDLIGELPPTVSSCGYCGQPTVD